MTPMESQSAGVTGRPVTGTRDTGIIVLSTSLAVLHINSRALELLQEWYPEQRQRPLAMPPPIVQLASELLAQKRERSAAGEQERVISRSWRSDPPDTVVVRGFTLRTSQECRDRVLLLIARQRSSDLYAPTRRTLKPSVRQDREPHGVTST
ncbi:hypothetical protein [Nitrospira moscoviensis]|uniref:Uncharacterized protein n=1 Tax=Nitrospira moscoviensis TaxID=42253 RepID=A0A0K2GHC0_NITMO|nr:hypothetical protein [Nitrospira moscoviensis]ALA60358.1 hypothetical protein NITMOv2_3974 [Nitrospira moscoviensis]